MSLRLILTRHAKSAWGDPVMDDHDRPLTGRGRRSAQAVGQWLAERDYVPDAALVSTANRTKLTWRHVAESFDAKPKPDFNPQLYHSEPETILELLQKAVEPVVMIVAHNPGIAYFAQALAEQPPSDARFAQYPTGATTVFDFPAQSWDKVTWRSGTIRDVVFARDLIGTEKGAPEGAPLASIW
jgi:phosphohistidine phosphatase